MEYDDVLNQLKKLRYVMLTNSDSSSAYHTAGQMYDALLFENISFREYTKIVKSYNRKITIEDDAKLIVDASNALWVL